jgi:glucose-1-phosphatase
LSANPTAVLFDLGGVLFSYDPERRNQYIGDAAGLPAAEVQARLFDTDFDARCESGQLDAAASHSEFCRLLGVDWSYEACRDALVSAFEADGIVFGLARELASVREVAGLTNNGLIVKEGLSTLHPDYSSVFGDRVYFSSEIDHLKPDVAAFTMVLERWGKQPGDVLFVDDVVENVMAAHELGFHVHRFFDAKTLETDLRGFGLL